MTRPHSTKQTASRRRRPSSRLFTSSSFGRFESLEKRHLLAADVITIQNPDNGVQIEFSALDFTPGSILTQDIIPLFQGLVSEVDTVFQAKLGSLLGSNNNVVLETGGLNSSYEITVIVQVTVELDSISSELLTVPGIGAIPKSGGLKLAPTQSDDAFGLKLFFDNTPDADELTGVGFADGALILESKPTFLSNNFTVFGTTEDPTIAQIERFDQSSNGDQFGIMTAIGIGATSLRGTVEGLNQEADVFLTPIESFQFESISTNTSNKTPFAEVDPSQAFFSNGDPGDGIIPDLGPINGITGPDSQFQADANASFTLERGSLHGYKYRDVNFNGIDDNGVARRLEGWQFYLDQNNNGVLDWTDAPIGAQPPNGVWDLGEGEQWTLTDANGEFWFSDLTVRDTNGEFLTYYVREVAQDGWIASTDPPEGIQLEFGVEYVALEGQSMIQDPVRRALSERILDANNDGIPDLAFGNSQTGSIHGIKYKDENANGLLDSTDTLLPGVVIQLDGTDGAGNPHSRTTVTDENGEYWFSDVIPGIYSVEEVVPAGYLASTPTLVENIRVTSSHAWVATVEQGQAMNSPSFTVLDGDNNGVPDLMFGNYEFGSIHGFEFKDVNANGLYEAGVDQRLAGVEFLLTGNDGMGAPVSISVTTDDNGEFWFTDLVPGDYSLTEIVPDGYLASTATSRGSIVVSSGLEWVAEAGQAMLADPLPPLSMKREEILDQDPDAIEDLRFGVYELGSIHGVKFRDDNANGSYDEAVDSLLGGIDFTLTGIDGMGNDVSLTTTTNDEGEFWFDGLTPGTYTLTEVLPAYFLNSTPTSIENIELTSGVQFVGAAGQAMLPDDLPALSMRREAINPSLWFGNYEAGSIHGLKYRDVDANGAYDGQVDEPMAGVVILLTGVDGTGQTVEASVETNDAGEFWFTDLVPGTYTVSEQIPDGFLASTGTMVEDISISSGLEVSGQAGQAMIPDPLQPLSQKRETVNDALLFGNYELGSIHGVKFLDADADGRYSDAVDRWLAGVQIELTGTDGRGNAVTRTTTTDDNGEFWFSDLTPGNYVVREVVPEGFLASTATETSEIVITSGLHVVARDGQGMIADPLAPLSNQREQTASELWFGNYETGSIHGFKFLDLNADGSYDVGVDRALAGVEFQLAGTDSLGNSVSLTTATDDDGHFWFSDLRPGQYTVTENVPDGFQSSTPTSTDPITVLSGIEFVGIDGSAMLPTPAPPLSQKTEQIDASLLFGNFEFGSIHGSKFRDVDADGSYDDTVDEPLAGITIQLTGVDGKANSVDLQTTTNDAGEFWFENLVPGTYTVTEVMPDGFVASTATEVNDLTITSGQEYVAVSGQAMLGNPPSPQSAKFETMEPGLRFGNFEYGSIHGQKFRDVDADGVYDASIDQWLAGITIRLSGTNNQGGQVELETTTDDQGEFWFTELLPGTYSVSEQLPAGILASTATEVTDLQITSGLEISARAGQAMIPANPHPASVKREEVNDLLSFGNYESGSIHGFKFNDVDGNGEYDASVDLPLANIEFSLTGTDNVGGDISQTVTTNDNGEFWFTDLRPGIYSVTETVTAPFLPTTPSSVSGIVVESGVEWVAMAGQAMLPDPLPAYSAKTEMILDADQDGNPDLIFGNALTTGSIHGFKFDDTDANGVYDALVDLPFEGIRFDLWRVSSTGESFIGSETTNADGEFWFENLTPGNYRVAESIGEFNGLVIATTATETSVQISGGDELVWRDGAAMLDPGDPIDMLKQEVLVGEQLMFGNYVQGSIHGFKFHDPDTDGVYNVDQGDSPKENATFELTGDVDLDGQVDTLTVQTNSDGEFWFVGLAPGEYTVRELTSHPDVQASTPTEITVQVASREEHVWRDGAASIDDSLRHEVLRGTELMFGNWTLGSIHGFKFDDFNADGIYDRAGGDRPFGGFAFELIDAAGDIVETVYSDYGGHFWFTGLVPGEYTVRERTEDFWPGIMASTPTEVSLVVGSGEELVFTDGAAHLADDAPQHEVNVGTDLMFGNYVKGSIHGFKFDDHNNDGVYDSAIDRPFGIPVEFELVQNDQVVETASTDSNGEFWFDELLPGEYVVREKLDSLPSMTHPSTATETTIVIGSRQEYVWTDGAAHLPIGALEKEVNVGAQLQFGNYIEGAIHGLKFEDMNANGQYDVGDMGWGGFGFDLIQNGEVIQTQTSDHGGAFWFTGLAPGTYTVVEHDTVWPDVMHSTNTSVEVYVGSGQELVFTDGASHMMGVAGPTTEVNLGGALMFGNFVKGSVHGFVFNDVDGDGNYEPDEGDTGRGGEEIVLSGDGVSILTTTNDDGEFWVEGLAPGDYFVGRGSAVNPTTLIGRNVNILSRQELAWTEGAAHLDPFALRDEVVVGSDLMFGEDSEQIRITSEIEGRHIFYNNSSFDGNDAAANPADDDAIATDKSALLPSQSATFANYTSYWHGINGIMIDISNLPEETVSANDFLFRVGNSNDTASWAPAPNPTSFSVRPGMGVNGSDRITITFDDQAIVGEWLRVTVLATANTGLTEPDTHFWGNAVGETGNEPNSAIVDGTDQAGARDNPRNFLDPAGIADLYDFNRDGLVNGTDVTIARDNFTNFITALQLITPDLRVAVAAIAADSDSRQWNSDDRDQSEKNLAGLASDEVFANEESIDEVVESADLWLDTETR